MVSSPIQAGVVRLHCSTSRICCPSGSSRYCRSLKHPDISASVLRNFPNRSEVSLPLGARL